MNENLKELILQAVIKETGITREQIFGGGRARPICDARNMTMFIMSHRFGIGVNEISRFIFRNHGTVCKNLKSATDLVTVDRGYRDRVQRIINNITQ